MPELPEVETVRRQLEPLITGSRIVDAGAHPSARFCDAVEARGHRISRVDRRGKYLLMGLAPCDEAGDGTAGTHSAERELVMHLGMTGGVHVGRTLPDDPYTRAWWSLDDDRFLVFRDVRRFGRIAVVARGEHSSLPTLHRLGPEPFDPTLDAATFHAALAVSRRRIKTNLLSQRPIAGLGNIYADESLWRAGISPSARRIGPERAGRLLQAIRDVLTESLANDGTTLRDYRTPAGSTGRNQDHLDCYGRGGEPCHLCGAVLVSRSIDQRTATWCPVCQAH